MVAVVQQGQTLLFRILGFIMRLAPIGAFGALAAAIGTNGSGTLVYLAWLVGTYYATVLFFVVVVFGSICALIGVSLLVYVVALKNKGLTVLDREQGSAWAMPTVAKAR